MSIVYENDLFAHQDRGYTDGIRIAWLSAEGGGDLWSRAVLDILSFPLQGHKRVSLAVGQSMYTPQDLSRQDIVEDDQPYAGWLYGTMGVVTDTGKVLDTVALTLGMVGPSSYAEQTQKAVHHIVGSPYPAGWKNQLHDELAGGISYQRKWRNIVHFTTLGLEGDASPDIGITVGTLRTDAAIGSTFRLGYDLPADYGPPRIRPTLPGSDFFIPAQTISGYCFSAIEGRAVAHTIFLDGNSYQSSPHVEKKPLVADIQIGAVLTYHRVRLSYTHVFMTKEFTTQKEASQYGGISLSYRF